MNLVEAQRQYQVALEYRRAAREWLGEDEEQDEAIEEAMQKLFNLWVQR